MKIKILKSLYPHHELDSFQKSKDYADEISGIIICNINKCDPMDRNVSTFGRST